MQLIIYKRQDDRSSGERSCRAFKTNSFVRGREDRCWKDNYILQEIGIEAGQTDATLMDVFQTSSTPADGAGCRPQCESHRDIQ